MPFKDGKVGYADADEEEIGSPVHGWLCKVCGEMQLTDGSYAGLPGLSGDRLIDVWLYEWREMWRMMQQREPQLALRKWPPPELGMLMAKTWAGSLIQMGDGLPKMTDFPGETRWALNNGILEKLRTLIVGAIITELAKVS